MPEAGCAGEAPLVLRGQRRVESGALNPKRRSFAKTIWRTGSLRPKNSLRYALLPRMLPPARRAGYVTIEYVVRFGIRPVTEPPF